LGDHQAAFALGSLHLQYKPVCKNYMILKKLNRGLMQAFNSKQKLLVNFGAEERLNGKENGLFN
jgi:hypothetical protein